MKPLQFKVLSTVCFCVYISVHSLLSLAVLQLRSMFKLLSLYTLQGMIPNPTVNCGELLRTPVDGSPYPLRVTRHWRRPSLRKMSTTVSMGVWSVTVKGLRFSIRLSFSGCGLDAGSWGASSVK